MSTQVNLKLSDCGRGERSRLIQSFGKVTLGMQIRRVQIRERFRGLGYTTTIAYNALSSGLNHNQALATYKMK